MSKVIPGPPVDLSDRPALQPDHVDPLSGIDSDTALWVDYDPDTVAKFMSADVIYSYDEGRSIVIAGTVPSYGYMARIAVPAVLRKPGPFQLRAGLVLRKGRLGLGVANDACTKFYDQTIIATPGQHLVELRTECADTPGNVVLRSGSPETTAVEFELLFLQFQLRSSEKRFKLTVLPEPKETHPVFAKFPCWTGKISGYLTANWIGALIDTRFFGEGRVTTETTITPPYPRPSTEGEEYFEWITLLQSVLEAQKSFTMVELGAGYGRWLVNAWNALRSIGKADIPLMLIGVEAEPTHFAWLRQHFLANMLDPEQHRLINAAVAPSDGVVYFTTGYPNETYAQSIVNSPSVRFSKWPDMSVREVPAVSLQTVLDGVGEVDLLDMDIQDAEGNVVHASANLLAERVKTVYIGTHSEESEYLLRITFNRLGWLCRYDYPCHRTSLTPYGFIKFQDGVQCWINPRFASEETLLRFEQP